MQKHTHEVTTSMDQNTSSVQPRVYDLKGFRGFTIKPNSPRTLQACKELGIDPDILNMRSEDEFKDPNGNIAELRYQHYIQRTHQLYTEIHQRRKEITMQTKLKYHANNSMEAGKQQKGQHSLDRHYVKKHIEGIYNRTVSYLHQSQESPELKNPRDVIQSDIYELSQLEGGLSRELNRYNKHKGQKIREAQIKLQEDAKRLQIMQRMKDKDVRILEQAMQRHLSIQQKKEQSKVNSDARQGIVDKQDRQYNMSKAQERDGSMAKFQMMELRLEEDQQRKLQKSKADEYKNKEKRDRVLQRKEEQERQEDQEMMEELQKLEERLNNSEKQHNETLQRKIEYIKEAYQKEQQLIKLHKEQNEQQSQDNLNTIIGRMVAKEKEFKSQVETLIIKEMDKRVKQKEKQSQIKINQQDLYKDQDKKLQEINDKFKRIEEQNQIRKKENEQKILLKQELRRLREQDKLDNQERQKRQNDYKMQSLHEKSKHADEKNKLKHYQHEVIQQTSMEINKYETLERQRVHSQLQQLSDTLFTYKQTQPHSLHQISEQHTKLKSLKLLKGITKPEDAEQDPSTKLVLSLFQPKVSTISNRNISPLKRSS